MIARLTALLLACLVSATTTAATAQEEARIVYIGIEGDPYYDPQALYTGLSLRDHDRPTEGLRLAFRDTRVLGRALGIEFELAEVLTLPADLSAALAQAKDSHPLAILLDLPADGMAAAVAQIGQTEMLINIRDRSDRWRGPDCTPGLLHTAPSDAMLADALAQHLRARGWTDILLLHGQTDADLEQAEAARRSAAKFGLRLTGDAAFALTNDPRRRDQSNIALLTGGGGYDVVWLVDAIGDFGRYVPFATYAPRPVVGSEGLTPRAWHWTFERYGAPQLNQRFRRMSDRDMTSDDWAAWAAVRAVVDAVVLAGSVDRDAVHGALRSPELAIDLYKGVRGNFRDWNGQMRQPILLATHNAVIAVAPLDGFEHQFDTLDTLGEDRAESRCKY